MGAQGDDVAVRRQYRHHLRGEGVQQSAGDDHDNDTQQYRDPAQASGHAAASRSHALPHQHGRGALDAVGGHIAQAFRRDSKGVCSDSHGAQGCHDGGGHDLRGGQYHLLRCHWRRDAEHHAQLCAVKVQTLTLLQPQRRAAAQDEIQQVQPHRQFRKASAQGGARRAQSRAGQG